MLTQTAIAEAKEAPMLAFAGSLPSAKYMVICLDFDGPYPKFPILSPILHWIQSDLQINATRVDPPLTSDRPCITNYVGPGPPPGSSPHRYIFLLYEQPSNFDSRNYAPAEGIEIGVWPRIRWSLAVWEKKVKLGKPVAMGYFTSN